MYNLLVLTLTMDELDQFYSTGSRGIKPVFFKMSDVIISDRTKKLSEYEVAMCTSRVVGRSMVDCAQQIRGLWRIYVKDEKSRNDLLANGIDVRSQHIALYQSNPFVTNSNDPKTNVIRITVKDLPISFSNDEVLMLMKKLNVNLTSQQVKYGYIRDDNDHLTDFKNGDRYVYAEAESVMNKPLPRFVMCGIFEVRLFHRGQFGQSRCNNCLGDDHYTSQCKNETVCKICEMPGHTEGNTACKYYEEQTNVTLVGGSRDKLSNMYPCDFTFMGVSVNSAEQAYQYGKAKRCKEEVLAEKILKAEDGFEAKRLGKFVLTPVNWEVHNQDLMEDVLTAKMDQVPECAEALEETGMTRIVEAVRGDLFWGSGMDKYKTKRIKKDMIPGKNRLGAMLSRLRESQRASEKKKKRMLSAESARSGQPAAKSALGRQSRITESSGS